MRVTDFLKSDNSEACTNLLGSFTLHPPICLGVGWPLRTLKSVGWIPLVAIPSPDQLPYGTFDLATQALGSHLVKNRYK